MAEAVVNIKGRDWKFILMPDRLFDKLHNAGGEQNVAMTNGGSYEVHFRKSDWDVITVRHELGHILYNSSLTGSAENQPDQVEEIFCEIIGHHWAEIGVWTDRITEKFFQG